MTKKALLDTNILVYLLNANSEFKVNLELLKSYELYIVDRSLLELYRTLSGKLKVEIKECLQIVRFFQNNQNYIILSSNNFSNQLTFKLAEENRATGGKIFDLDILAIAIDNEIDIIFTKNIKDFPKTEKVKVLDPT